MIANRSSWPDWLYWWCTVGFRLDDCFATLMTGCLSERMNVHPTTWLAVSIPSWLSDYRRHLGRLRLWNESSQILTNGGRLKMIKGKKAARCGREERREGRSQRGITLLSMLLHTWKPIPHLLSLHIHIYVSRRTQTHTNGNPFQGVSPPAVPVNRIKSESATSRTKIYRSEAFSVFQVTPRYGEINTKNNKLNSGTVNRTSSQSR